MTETETKFVEAFAGDVGAAALAAGISTDEASALLKRVVVQDAMRARELDASGKKSLIATATERKEFWTEVMRGGLVDTKTLTGEVDIATRLKASELLGKSECDFSEKRIHTGPDGGPILSLQATVNSVDLADRARLIMAKRVLPELDFVQ
ncbi:MAG: hypothetical protein WCS70_06800 [Verrucomicrobiota bacterium]